MAKDTKNETVNNGGVGSENTMKTYTKNQLIVVFIIGLLLGTVGSPIVFQDRSGEANNEDATTEETSDETTNSETSTEDNTDSSMMEEDESVVVSETNNQVVVRDQLAGDRVFVDSVSLSDTGWVVVHEDIDGTVGNALGAQRLEGGEHERVYVELLRNTVLDNLYYVVLYNDNGDGEFSLDNDMQLQNNEGELIGETFTTIVVDRNGN